MDSSLTDKAKAPAGRAAAAPETTGATGGWKAAARGMSYAEGERMLAPGAPVQLRERAGASTLGAAQKVGGKGVKASKPGPVETLWGTYTAPLFEPYIHDDGQASGLEIYLRFAPSEVADATKIGLTQAVRTRHPGVEAPEDRQRASRTVADGDHAGYSVDRLRGKDNPIYGAEYQPEGDLADTPREDGNYQLGHSTHVGGDWSHEAATLFDVPKIPGRKANAAQEFETTAVALAGAQKGRYYGSVRWGWRTDARGDYETIPLTQASEGDPTEAFIASAELWNDFEYTAAVSPPDRQGRSRTTRDLEVEIGGARATLAAWSEVVIDRLAKPEGDRLSIRLGDSVVVAKGGAAFKGWLDAADVAGTKVLRDTTLDVDGAPVRISKGAQVDAGDEVHGVRFAFVEKGTLRGLPEALREATALAVDIRGGGTVDLPIPGDKGTKKSP